MRDFPFLFPPSSFSLNTTVAAAHNGQIGSMCFCPSSKTTVLVTTSKDGHFKAWLLGGDVDAESKSSSPPQTSDFLELPGASSYI